MLHRTQALGRSPKRSRDLGRALLSLSCLAALLLAPAAAADFPRDDWVSMDGYVYWGDDDDTGIEVSSDCDVISDSCPTSCARSKWPDRSCTPPTATPSG